MVTNVSKHWLIQATFAESLAGGRCCRCVSGKVDEVERGDPSEQIICDRLMDQAQLDWAFGNFRDVWLAYSSLFQVLRRWRVYVQWLVSRSFNIRGLAGVSSFDTEPFAF